ncbi:hypothetical protein NT2_08_00530 [Caenibius tardaugens NBRC 16725]|uniref:HTH araC/xylS-type domain-containing protein n=1 Tax=Caenibius tardaugens NBRC 16725 TaxID=1219035 RepID=U2YA75_9SPHN|nr:helix-turn-helix transcriptional regulator [Caenibius tardaugens]AZI35081.1 AraC family transcriptional regulator [Caenibius tardaugens NBRC 16725]GAD50266.1 hypothetical protein NT2_08_00530 [Caenibius tardaugens NBRC 16725]
MLTHGHESLVRVDTAHVVAELITHLPDSREGEVFEEPLHTIALQQRQPSYSCQGRYRVPNMRPDFQNIGRLLVLPAHVPLEVCTAERPDEVVRCMFTQEVLEEYGGDGHIFDGNVLSSLLNFRHPGIEDILNLLGNELRAPGFASKALVESLGMTLLIQFARYVREYPKGDVVYRGGLSRRHLRIITEAVEGNARCPSLSELSELAGVSLRHLTRSFKESTGMTVYAYVEQVRFEKARALLADTDLLVKDIAYRLGFSCASSLSVAFRKLAGESPQDYRKRVGRLGKAGASYSSH